MTPFKSLHLWWYEDALLACFHAWKGTLKAKRHMQEALISEFCVLKMHFWKRNVFSAMTTHSGISYKNVTEINILLSTTSFCFVALKCLMETFRLQNHGTRWLWQLLSLVPSGCGHACVLEKCLNCCGVYRNKFSTDFHAISRMNPLHLYRKMFLLLSPSPVWEKKKKSDNHQDKPSGLIFWGTWLSTKFNCNLVIRRLWRAFVAFI